MAHGKVEDKSTKPCCSDPDAKLVKATDLPLHGNPHPPKDYIVNEKPGMLETKVTLLRTTIQPYIAPFGTAYQRTSDFVATGVAHSKSRIDQLSENRSSLTKALVMGGSGLVGVMLARRGFFRRVIFGSTLFLGAGLACYPAEFKEKAQIALYLAENKLPGAINELSISIKHRLNSNKSEQTSKEADSK